MRKRIMSWLLVIVMCFALLGCGENTADAGMQGTTQSVINTTLASEPAATEPTEPSTQEAPDGTTTPVLYKVMDTDGNLIWLFGSIHVGREDYYPLPAYVLDAFASSDALAVEMDIIAFESDLSSQIKVLQGMIYTDGTTIKDHISSQTYDSAVRIMKENGLYNAMLDYYMPAIWYSLVDNCLYMQIGADAELGVDRHLLELAKESEKEILEVESAELQYGLLAGFSEQLQVFLLEEAIAGYEDLAGSGEAVNALMDIWATGDEQGFADYYSEENQIEDPQEALLYEEFNNAMIVSRNESMTQYAVEALRSGKEVFICVGAAHIIGQGAVAQRLRQLGYSVEVVLA